MSIWVIIPVKPLKLAKSRLSAVISPEQREQFAEAMLRHLLRVLRDVPQIAGTLVISRDNRALSIAREYRAHTVQESGAPELNAALMRATQVVRNWNSEAVLILPADLPFIVREDVIDIIRLGQRYQGQPTVVIATDRGEDGTNALYISPPGLIPYAYGPGSYRRHAMLARDAGAIIEKYSSERMLWDIDLPEDLLHYQRMIEEGRYQSLSFPDQMGTLEMFTGFKKAN